jgi:hypothetical protein
VKRLVILVFALVAMSSEAIATLEVIGGSPPGCC